ncbi:MAG: YidC/Oxa1 family membrane protein insertase [Patescibacteria group bacterium]|jgi:YidC/Oxa1 family membrane protein insertase
MGISIIVLTLLIRLVLVPVVIPSLRNMKKQRDLQPLLDKLKAKYSHDKKVLAEKQMALFKEHGINPASGCLNQILMIIVLIALYGVIRRFSTGLNLEEINKLIYSESMKFTSMDQIKTKFLYLNLEKPDPYLVLAILSGLFQLVASKMMAPYAKAGEKAAKKTPDKKDDLAYNMQSQMLYTMPIMNVIIGARLPAGVVLYLVTTTVFSVAQTYFVSGLGGLKSWVEKLQKWKK